MFHLICSLGEEDVATSLFLKKREKDSRMRKRRMFDYPSFSSTKDLTNLIDKIVTANVRIHILRVSKLN
jgi:hypothetical protein